jgi:hypothetical protein
VGAHSGITETVDQQLLFAVAENWILKAQLQGLKGANWPKATVCLSRINLSNLGWLELTFGIERVGEIVDGDLLRLRFPTGGRQNAEEVFGGGGDLATARAIDEYSRVEGALGYRTAQVRFPGPSTSDIEAGHSEVGARDSVEFGNSFDDSGRRFQQCRDSSAFAFDANRQHGAADPLPDRCHDFTGAADEVEHLWRDAR